MAIVDDAALEKLLEIIGGDKDSLIELIESFLVEAPNLINQLKQAAALNDIELLGRAAHTMRSSAMDFGAESLAALCATLETESKQGAVSDAPQQAADIENAFEDVKQVLEKKRVELF